MKTCPTGKKSFVTAQLAEDALIGAWTSYEYTVPSAPVTIYQCEDCGQFHFTSKGEMNKRLAELIASGRLQRMRQADQWEHRLRNKGKFW